MTPVQSAGLHVGTFSAGFVAAVSYMASSNVDLYSAYEHAYAGVKELMAAWAIIAPVLAGGYAVYKSTTKQKMVDAVTAPNAVEVAREIKPTLEVVAVANALKSNGVH